MTNPGADVGVRAYLSDVLGTDRGRIALALGLSVVATLSESIGLLLLVPLIVSAGVVDEGSTSVEWLTDALDAIGVPISFGWILVVYVVLVSIRAGVGWARQLVVAKLRYEFVDGLRHRLFEALARADWSFHLRQRSSDLSHVLAADIARVQSGTTAFFDVVSRVLATVGYLVVALRLSWQVTVTAIVVLTILVLALWPTVGRARLVGRAQTVGGRENFAVQQQFLESFKLVKSHGAEEHHVDEYRRGIGEVRAAQFAFDRVSARSTALLQVGIAASIAVLAWLAVEVFETEGARLLVLIAVIARLAPMASTTLSRGQMVANMLPAYESALGWIEDAEAAEERPAPPASSESPAMRRSVELDHVSFAYADGTNVLDAVSLGIDVATTVGVVGPSGIGKTTLADIVLGLIEPNSGTVRIDGVPLADYGVEAWRRQVAYVPQETFLFNDTLRSNITWFDRDAPADDRRIAEVVAAAALTEVVDTLPDGLDTVVGDRGIRLSGGERQRVAIARALWRRPSLLVLDEATSALDRENERSVQAAIDRLHGQVAMLVISHRPETLDAADQVVRLGPPTGS